MFEGVTVHEVHHVLDPGLGEGLAGESGLFFQQFKVVMTRPVARQASDNQRVE